ncbi:SDR family NAD(P)-dependent oxidoreductase [Streptomyces silvisoli]|uniref:SDR family NAD(P)-dependent oxidoreductase n=1 Tax=Streptomyces silvisoli TaxID=3034235 RepID=A0ABT5ZWD2_9ACTN|nr:SDR family NAD(P)-dependent oxidoreductase [Streptomyces silvisoli]MDF3294138.1 SDR family NAD(P)-dependent oxidoreductase [Streptomyces silvisoli]
MDRSGAVAEAVRGGRCVFAFSGNGAQWPGMAADLLTKVAVFRETVEEADRVLAPLLGWSVLDEMRRMPEGNQLRSTAVAQPMLFAVQIGIAKVLRAQGVEPTAVVGHSVGEIPAAYVTGALTLEDAALVVATRSRLQAQMAGQGRMASVTLPREEAEEAIAPFCGVEIACVNSGRDVTVAGPADAVEALVEDLRGRRIVCTLLDLDYAFHSRAMDPAEAPLKSALSSLSPRLARIPMISCVTGTPIDGAVLDADYWWLNMRQAVLFAPAIEHLLDKGYDVFADIGPHPILRPYLRRIADGTTRQVALVPTVVRGEDGPTAMSHATAALIASGAEVDWHVHFPKPGRVVTLPAYPWQRRRYWSGDASAWTGGLGKGGGYDHPLLGDRMREVWPTWKGAVEPGQAPWLGEHRVGGAVILPATGFVEMALAAGRRVFNAPAEVTHLELYRAVVVPWNDPGQVLLHVAFSPEDGIVSIGAGEGGDGQVQQHARGLVRRLLRACPSVDLAAVEARCVRLVDVATQYRELAAAGLDYGPAFQVLRELRVGDGEVIAAYRHVGPTEGYEAHPALLDGAIQAGVPLLADLMADGRRAYLPSALDAVRVWRTPPAEGRVHVRERARTSTEVCWDIIVTDPDGAVVAELEGCRLRCFDGMRTTPLSIHVPVMRAAPHTGLPCEPSPLPRPSVLAEEERERITALLPDWRRHHWDRARRALFEITAYASAAAFAGLLPDPAQPFTIEDLIECGVLVRHRRAVELFASIQEEHGLLRRQDDGRWQLTRTDLGVEDLVHRLVRDLPSYCTETALYAFNAPHLGEIWRGTLDPLEALVCDGGMERFEHFFSTAPVMHHLNRTVQALVGAMVARWPADRPLRVLEVGAGTGGTTRALLPLLPPERTRYLFTDVSPLFLSRSEERFADWDFLEQRTLDLDRDLVEQGFTDSGFDLVIASNALHTSRDLTGALARVRRLLAPGGHLLAVETHNARVLAPQFGMMEAFWSFTDHELRPDGILLPADSWPPLLRQVGYTDVVQNAHEATCGDFSVLLAAAPGGAASPVALPAASPDGRWIVAADPTAAEGSAPTLCEALVESLRTTGAPVRHLPAPTDVDRWQDLLEAESAPTVTVAFVLAGETRCDAATELRTATHRAAVLRAFAAACERLPAVQRIVLWLITRPTGALPAPELPISSVDATSWGLARTLANEHPRITVRRLSLDAGDDPVAAGRRATRELLTRGDEDEIALTRGGRFVPRITDRTITPQGTTGPADVPAFTLNVHSPGLAYRLAWTETERPAPGPGEVVITVRAAALNYRDLMQTLGVLPADADAGFETQVGPGMECAGVVEAVGEGVCGIAIGDRVAALAPGALASHVCTTADAVMRVPDDMTWAEAATMPVVFLTVHYSLGHLARLAPGETVLIHAGAGGVGLAALQYARHVGARVIATAGDPVKRALLHNLGVEHVLDSRTLDFAEQVRQITGGRGVEVVVNSLAGEAISRGLETLAFGGRFIELGKRDIYENKPLLLRPFAKNIAFFGVDLTALLHDPDRAREQFRQIGEAIRTGRYRPLLHTVHPAARIADAFRLMQHSRHIGKIVITFDPLDEPPAIERHRPVSPLSTEATYLVTGGLSGFGAATARWLADRGARHLALVSRRGDQSPEAPALLADLAGRGVHAHAYTADITDPEALHHVARAIDASGHPLRGIAHCAMHLDDAPLTELTDDRFRAVLAPKLTGAHTLNALTADRPIDLFLSYSSVAATIGHITQAPYAAGNLYLEALTRHRRHEGHHANVISWGAIGETGYVARNNLTRTMAQAGIEPLTPAEAFRTLQDTLVTGEASVAIGRYNWIPLTRLLPTLQAPRIALLLPSHIDATAHTHEEFLALLAELSPAQAHQFIADSMAELLAAVLHTTADRIDHHRRLDEYGLDSLMGTELLVTVRQQYDIDIPPMELLRSNGTIADFARIIHTRLGLATAPTDTPRHLPGPRTRHDPTTPQACP